MRSITGRIRTWRALYPQIPLADFQRGVQYIRPAGRHASAAEASFLTLSHARGKGFWLTLYKRLPGFAAVSELIYAFIAAHRSAAYRVTRFLWGKDYGPPRYDFCSFLFLRLFGLIYLSAFVFFWRPGAGTDRQPRHPAGRGIGRCHRRPGRRRAFLCDAHAVLDQRRRSCHSGGVLGRRGILAAIGLQCAAAPLPVSALCAVSLAALWRADFHVLSVGHVSAGGRFSFPADEFRPNTGYLAAALAAVSLHVHVGDGQAAERRSELVEPIGAVVSLFHPAAAHAVRLVCRALATDRC